MSSLQTQVAKTLMFTPAIDYNAETATNDAHFRQYSPAQGRWMSPDPYDGSYDFSNPQSLNRYSYVMNNPLSGTDPTGQIFCGVSAAADGGLAVSGPIGWAVLGTCVGETILKLFDWFGGPSFHGTLKPRPEGTGSPDWANVDASLGETLGLPSDMNWSKINPGIAGALGLPDAGCEFGACGGGLGFQQGSDSSGGHGFAYTVASIAELFGTGFAYADWTDPNHRLYGTHYCGPGGGGSTVNGLDRLCQAHDMCYAAAGLSAASQHGPLTAGQNAAMAACNQSLCDGLKQLKTTPGTQEAEGRMGVSLYFTLLSRNSCHF
jgi:RHS repeat-associated protein